MIKKSNKQLFIKYFSYNLVVIHEVAKSIAIEQFRQLVLETL